MKEIEIVGDDGVFAAVVHRGGGGEVVEVRGHFHLEAFRVHERGVHDGTPSVEGVAIFGGGDKGSVLYDFKERLLCSGRAVGIPDFQSVALRSEPCLGDFQSLRNVAADDAPRACGIERAACDVARGGVAEADENGGIHRGEIHERIVIRWRLLGVGARSAEEKNKKQADEGAHPVVSACQQTSETFGFRGNEHEFGAGPAQP